MPRAAGQSFGVEGKNALEEIEKEQEEKSEGAEHYGGQRVLLPGHLLGRVDAHEFAEPLFDRPQQGGEEGPFAGHDVVHIFAQRDGQQNQDQKIKDILQDVVGHFSSPLNRI